MRRLLAEALERPPAERRSFLHRACGDDEALRRRVDALLRHEGRGDLLARSPLPEALLTDPPLRETSLTETELHGEDDADGAAATLPRLGRYRLLRKLGDGGMGTVYLARREDASKEDPADGERPREVAVKILKPGLDTGELLAQGLTTRVETLGDDHGHTALARRDLAALRLERGDARGARELLERALETLARVRGDDDPDTAEVESLLGAALAAEGRCGEAEKYLHRGHEVLEHRRGPEAEPTRAARRRLADFCGPPVAPVRPKP